MATALKTTSLPDAVYEAAPEALGAHLKADAAKWGPVIKAANIKVSE